MIECAALFLVCFVFIFRAGFFWGVGVGGLSDDLNTAQGKLLAEISYPFNNFTLILIPYCARF